MQKVQLYVEGVELDLFNDEIIQLTSTIKDIKDIGKVFTDYSQTFTVPASKTNNKIFRHYYNYSITGGAFDSRKKKSAQIQINYSPFRVGKIALNSVKMRMNKAYAYELIFYGNTVSLRDLMGDDELTNLADLSNYNHDYSESNVRTGLTTGLNLNSQTNSIIYPLITSKKRLFFNSDSDAEMALYNFLNSTGNLYCDESNSPSSLSTDRGLEYTDLKPAIRCIHIIEAIESQYNLLFTRDFFSSDVFDNLYFWINSKEGEIADVEDDEPYLFSHKLSGYTYSSGVDSAFYTFSGSDISVNHIGQQTLFSLDVTVSNQNIPYTVVFRNKTKGNQRTESGLGDGVFDYTASNYEPAGVNETDIYEIEIQSKSEMTISSAVLEINYFNPPAAAVDSYYSTTTNQTTDFELLVIDRLPKMKVIDFLTGIFKMFNLTAYYIDDVSDSDYGKIYVDTLDNYYEDALNNRLGGLVDIDDYLDITEHTVNSLLPFTDINFKYQETNTVLMNNHFEQFNEVFGNAEFNVKRAFPDEIDRGTKYDIDVPFSHMKYERLVDLGQNLGVNATTSTVIQWGYCAGGQFKADNSVSPPTGDYDKTSIQPLLFYAIHEDNLPQASNANSFRSGRINWISTSPSTALTSYWRPSNASDSGNTSTPPTYTINFDQEFDEWQSINYGENSNSLYNLFYKTYVESVFNPAKRIFNVTAHLPTRIIVNLKLNDQIRIQNRIFRINSITMNLNTGKSDIELLNIFSNEIVE
jgi:hypothetical protein